MSKRIAVVGGGPGGLFFATLMKKRRPEWEITLFERNQADDAFGFGVVFSDATLRKIEAADSVLTDGLAEHGKRWEAIDVVAKGETRSFGGNGMSAIHRRTLLRLLQEKAAAAGVDMRFGEFVPDPARRRGEPAPGVRRRQARDLGGRGYDGADGLRIGARHRAVAERPRRATPRVEHGRPPRDPALVLRRHLASPKFQTMQGGAES